MLGINPERPAMSPDERVADAERRIGEVISDFAASNWLRDAARAALDRDPLDAAIDAKVLHDLLHP